MDTPIAFTLNGESRSVVTDPERPLLDVLREDLRLTGTKYGCGEGECRACTVLLDGKSIPSCITSIGAVQGKQVRTIEGLAKGDSLHPVQQAFLDEAAFQCGYCTAGMILGTVAAMDRNPHATAEEVLTELQTHLCRCCSYAKYQVAVRRVVANAKTASAASGVLPGKAGA